MTDAILFDHGIPSSFYQAEIVIIIPAWSAIPGPCTVPSNEHGFQLIKDLVAGGHHTTEILDAPTAAEARRIGKYEVHLSEEQRRSWDAQLALPTMLQVNLAKYTQHKICHQWLMQTDDAELIEHRPDPIWGDNLDGTGKNLLGRVLMFVRASLR